MERVETVRFGDKHDLILDTTPKEVGEIGLLESANDQL